MIAIGSDHGGFLLKQEIKAYLEKKQIPYKDYGCYDEQSCDYAFIAKNSRHQRKGKNVNNAV